MDMTFLELFALVFLINLMFVKEIKSSMHWKRRTINSLNQEEEDV